MLPTLPQRDNWTRIRGQLTEQPKLTMSDLGTELCSLVIRSEASTIRIKAAGRTARKAGALRRGAHVEIVGAVVVQPSADDEPEWTGVMAAAIRPHDDRARGLVGRAKRFGTGLGALVLLAVWPGGFVLAELLAAAVWGIWNAGLVFVWPQVPPLRFARCIRYVGMVLIAGELVALAARHAPGA